MFLNEQDTPLFAEGIDLQSVKSQELKMLIRQNNLIPGSVFISYSCAILLVNDGNDIITLYTK